MLYFNESKLLFCSNIVQSDKTINWHINNNDN